MARSAVIVSVILIGYTLCTLFLFLHDPAQTSNTSPVVPELHPSLLSLKQKLAPKVNVRIDSNFKDHCRSSGSDLVRNDVRPGNYTVDLIPRVIRKLDKSMKCLEDAHRVATDDVRRLEAEIRRIHRQYERQKMMAARADERHKVDPIDISQTELFIMIPSVARRHSLTGQLKTYLVETLDSLLKEIQVTQFRAVHVYVFNNDKKEHEVYERARDELFHGASSVNFVNLSRDDAVSFRKLRKVMFGKSVTPNIVRQTWDIVENLNFISQKMPKSAILMLMEDDFGTCPDAMNAIQTGIAQASQVDADWIDIRYSYGLNGLVMRARDVQVLANYLKNNALRRPPDHLSTEFFVGETEEAARWKNGRLHFAFRFNLFSHFGTTSSLRDTEQTGYPQCYEQLSYPVLFEVEAFDPVECGDTTVWPCTPFSDRVSLHKWEPPAGVTTNSF